MQDSGGGKALAFGDHTELAGCLTEDLSATGGALVSSEDTLYQFDGRIWCEVRKPRIIAALKQYHGATVYPDPETQPGAKPKTLKLSQKDYDYVYRLMLDTLEQPDFFRDAVPGLAFSDCFVRVDGSIDYTLKVEPHSPEQRSRHIFDYSLSEVNTPAVNYESFLTATFTGCQDANERVGIIEEYIALALVGLAPLTQQFLLYVGRGADGKSALIKIHEGVFPEHSTCHLQPSELASEYSRAALAGKLINFVTDIDDSIVKRTGSIKALTTGDAVRARHPFGRSFSIRPIAGHVFSANKMLAVTDFSKGWQRRIVPIEFPNTIASDAQIRRLPEIILQRERAAIVGRLLVALQRVLARGCKLNKLASSDALLQKSILEIDPVSQFLHECADATPSAPYALSREVYSRYRSWHLTSGHRQQMTYQEFLRRLDELGIKKIRSSNRRCLAISFGGADREAVSKLN